MPEKALPSSGSCKVVSPCKPLLCKLWAALLCLWGLFDLPFQSWQALALPEWNATQRGVNSSGVCLMVKLICLTRAAAWRCTVLLSWKLVTKSQSRLMSCVFPLPVDTQKLSTRNIKLILIRFWTHRVYFGGLMFTGGSQKGLCLAARMSPGGSVPSTLSTVGESWEQSLGRYWKAVPGLRLEKV